MYVYCVIMCLIHVMYMYMYMYMQEMSDLAQVAKAVSVAQLMSGVWTASNYLPWCLYCVRV